MFINQARLLIKARKQIGITQTQLSKKLGYTPQFVCNWEKGKSSIPPRMVRKIVKILKVKESLFLDAAIADFVAQYVDQLRGK